MSTHCHIGMELADGRVRYIYVHLDGYPGHTGRFLDLFYSSPSKLETLMDLGDLHFLGQEIGKKHNPRGTRHREWTKADGRDFGERGKEAQYAESAQAFLADVNAAEYLYLYAKGRWTVTPAGGATVELTPQVIAAHRI